jgi:hypothetical protein
MRAVNGRREKLCLWFQSFLCKNWNFDLKCEFVSYLHLFIHLFQDFAFAVFAWTRWVLNSSWRIWRSLTL